MTLLLANPILIDLILAGIILLFTVLGVKRGFVLTLCSLIAVLVALWGANFLADTLSPKVADTIQPKLEQTITKQLNDAISHTEFDGASGGESTSIDEVPLGGVLDVLRISGLYQGLIGQVEDALNGGLASTAASAVAQVASAIAGQLAHGSIFLLGFVLILIAWFIFSHALDLVTKLPVLNGVNRFLGGVLGLVKGLVISYIAAWALCSLTGVIPPQVAEQTYLLSLLRNFQLTSLLHLF